MSVNPEFDTQDLLRAARAGDGSAQGRLMEMYRNYLILLARLQIGRRLQGKVDPSDLVQETFLNAHRDFAGFRGKTEEEIVVWLRRILATRLAMTVRRYHGVKGRDVRLERELAGDLEASSKSLNREFVAPFSSPSQHAAGREQAVLLADALRELPEDYREVIILRHMEGLPFPLVARQMGRSVDSVKKLWMRGLVQLRRLLSA